MKMTLNKLIANDIINYGMNQTSNFDYSVYLDSYIDDYDIESRNYILNNLEDICECISKNENISHFEYNKNTKEFDMTFYWGNLMNEIDKFIYDILEDLGKEDNFELEDIKELSNDLLLDDSTKNLAIEKIRNSKKMEIDL